MGPIEVHNFSGPVEVWIKDWQPQNEINVQTFSGRIELHVPESARGSVAFGSFSGHLTSAMPLTLQSSDGRTLSFKTFSGNVRIYRRRLEVNP